MSNAIDFLYFNPEFQASSNVITVEQATAYLASNSSANTLVPDRSTLPSDIDPFSVLTTNRDTIPISWFNNVIYRAMSNEGLNSNEIYSKAKYVSSIAQNVIYTSNNNFQIGNNYYTFDSNNLRVGDQVKIFDNVASTYFFQVTAVYAHAFVVDTNPYVTYSGSNYVLDGIKTIDPLRLASIGLSRNLATLSNVAPDTGVFNPTLYKVLYQDAARLTDQQAYADFISKRKANILRVNNAEDILGNFVNTSNVKITGVNVVMSSNGASNRLISEFGVKQYTDSLFNAIGQNANFTEVVITSNFVAQGDAALCNNVYVASNLYVKNSTILTGTATLSNTLQVMQNTYLNSNVFINRNALIYGSLSVAGNTYNPRIGIGYYMDSNAAPSNVMYYSGSNVGIGSSNPSERLEVVGNVKVSNGSLYVSNGSIGIGLSNPSYLLQLSTDSAAKPSSTTWTVSSDRRLKENICEADNKRCYDIVKSLKLNSFKWRDEYISASHVYDRTKLGWIAQDVENVFPKAVKKSHMYGIKDCRTLDTDQIYATMYGAIQHLQQLVEDLQKENQDIKTFMKQSAWL
jgi:hypothetical protein